MSSGYLPLDPKHDEAGKDLVKIKEDLERFLKEARDPYGGYFDFSCLTPEDAQSDGGYLERLYIALDFINYCIKNET